MSVDKKIKQILESKKTKKQELKEAGEAGDQSMLMQGSSQKATYTTSGIADSGAVASSSMTKDNSKSSKVATAGDATMPKQGSSQEAPHKVADETVKNLGAQMSASVSKDTTLPEKGKGDAKSVKVPAMEEEQTEEEVIQEVDYKDEIKSLFGEDASEEFTTKATSIFEAAVIARVNNEMEKITGQLQEQQEEEFAEFKVELVEKVDSYLNYVVEQWAEENNVAIENGLKNEISEDFMMGLKKLFVENHITVPENQVDLVEELSTKVEQLSSELNDAINDNIEMSKSIVENRKAVLVHELSDDLASTEAEKLKKLMTGVEYEDDETYIEKVNVIKENYFPKSEKKSPEQVLTEETGTNASLTQSDSMSKYVAALSRTVKSR